MIELVALMSNWSARSTVMHPPIWDNV